MYFHIYSKIKMFYLFVCLNCIHSGAALLHKSTNH